MPIFGSKTRNLPTHGAREVETSEPRVVGLGRSTLARSMATNTRRAFSVKSPGFPVMFIPVFSIFASYQSFDISLKPCFHVSFRLLQMNENIAHHMAEVHGSVGEV